MAGPWCEQVPDRSPEPPDVWQDEDDDEYIDWEYELEDGDE